MAILQTALLVALAFQTQAPQSGPTSDQKEPLCWIRPTGVIQSRYIRDHVKGLVPGYFVAKIHVDFDEKGHITQAKLEQSTGSLELDKTIETWAKSNKLCIDGQAGSGILPITLSAE